MSVKKASYATIFIAGVFLLSACGGEPSPDPGESETTATPTPTPTYAVGDAGPGGGIIYYVDNAGFNCGAGHTATGSPTGGKCNYLEVAPSGWNTGSDPAKLWAVTDTNVPGITDESSFNNSSTGIGLGYQNSLAIVAQGNDATTAAGAARAYAGGSKNDWYLPTTAELNLLCQWGRGISPSVTTACTGGAGINSPTYGAASAGFVENAYWSSSEYFAYLAWTQYFSNGYQLNYDKPATAYVRPVRAF